MRVVGLNYLRVPPVAVDRNMCLSASYGWGCNMLHSSISRNTARETRRQWVPGKGLWQKAGISCICVLLVAATCSVQAAASESLVELSYDRVKFASACSSFALRSCTACPCSFVFMWHAYLKSRESLSAYLASPSRYSVCVHRWVTRCRKTR